MVRTNMITLCLLDIASIADHIHCVDEYCELQLKWPPFQSKTALNIIHIILV